ETEKQLVTELHRLPDAIDATLKLNPLIANYARHFIDKNHALFLGRGLLYPIALEGALKLKEISYIQAEGYPAGELKHGPLALVEQGSLVVVLATRSATQEKLMSNVEEVRARGGRIVAIASVGDRAIEAHADQIIRVPDTPE